MYGPVVDRELVNLKDRDTEDYFMPRSEWPRLTRSPVVEAVLDLRISKTDASSVSMLDSIESKIKKKYPEKKARIQSKSEFSLANEAIQLTAGESIIDAYFLSTTDAKYVLQARFDGFTFSRLRPYENWCAFRAEAAALWSVYRSSIAPDKVVRVGTRYINVLELPGSLRDFNDFLTASPQPPPRLAQQMATFSSSITMPLPELGAHATIIQSLLQPTEAILPVLLDIDVFTDKELPANDDAGLWDVIDSFHEIRNQIFFESVTERMVSLCM